jgi:hypothetical protein
MNAEDPFREFADDARSPDSQKEPMPNKAIVAFAFGKGMVLLQRLDDWLEEFIVDSGGSSEQYCLDLAAIDYKNPGDGVWVASVKAVDDGPSDWAWDDGREVMIQFYDFRPVTEEEWKAHREGEWPW